MAKHEMEKKEAARREEINKKTFKYRV